MDALLFVSGITAMASIIIVFFAKRAEKRYKARMAQK